MKRLTTASLALAALAWPASALASTPTSAHRAQYRHDYQAARGQFGSSAVGCDLLGGRGSCHINASDEQIVTSLEVLDRMLAPPPPVTPSTAETNAAAASSAPDASTSQATQTAATQPTGGSSSGGLADVPGVPASFAACVALRESTNGTASSNVYGIISAPGGNGSLAEQKQAFAQLYQQDGAAPWAPYDGC